MTRCLLRIAVLCLATLSAAFAQTTTPAPSNERREVRTYSLPPDKLAKAIEYAQARNRLHFLGVAYDVLVLAGVLAWKLAPRIRDWAEAVSQRRIVQAYIFGPLLFLAIDVATLPQSLYAQSLSLKYEQSIQGWGSWFWDWTKGELIEFVVGSVLLWIFYGAIRRSPRRWWFYSWLVAIPIIVFLMFIAPVVISPMFYRFEPLAEKQPALVAEIAKVVARGGLEIPREPHVRDEGQREAQVAERVCGGDRGVEAGGGVGHDDPEDEYGRDSVRLRPRDGALRIGSPVDRDRERRAASFWCFCFWATT